MNNEIPDPMTPPECDLSDFQYMELDVRRLRDSKFASTPSGNAFRAGLMLWCAAWHQIPAASLPDDDVELASLAGFGRMPFSVKEWKKLRAEALHGFVKCSDGRLYHPVISEKAISAFAAKSRHAYGKFTDRLRKENAKREREKRPVYGIPTPEQWKSGAYPNGIPPETPDDSNGIPPENSLRGNGTERNGKGTEQIGNGTSIVSPPTGAAAKPKAAPPTNDAWQAYSEAYAARYSEPPIRNATVNGLLKQVVNRLGAEAPMVSAFYVRSQNRLYVAAGHALNLLVRDAEKLRTEWATGHQGTQAGAIAADRTAANFNAFAPLLAEAESKELHHAEH